MSGAKEAPRTKAQMLSEIERLRARLDEAEQTLEAIRTGDVDALVVSGPQGKRIFSLTGAERIYRVIVETMNEAALMVSPDGTILFCNRRFCSLIGIPMETAVGQKATVLVAPPQQAPLSRLLAEARTGPVQRRLSLRAANGDAVSAQLAASPLEGEGGPDVCLVISDLTEVEASARSIRVLREYQQALEASAARYRALVEMAPDAIVVHQNERFVYANPAALQLYGATSTDQLLGRYILDLMHPDEPATIHDWTQTVVGGETTPLRATRLRRLDGQEVPAEITATVTHWQEQPAVQVIIRDITERKHAEMALETARAEVMNEKKRLEAVMEALPVGVALVDVHGGIIRSNTAFDQVWGGRRVLRTVADYVAYTARWLDTGQPVQPEEWASAQAVQQKRLVTGQLLQIERFDGTRGFILNSAAPLFDAEGEVVGAAVGIQDVTDLQKAEEALRGSEALHRAELEQRVTERTGELAQAFRALERQTRQLRALTAEVTLAEQRERRRLADVLHDDLQQLLVATRLRAHMLGRVEDVAIRQVAQEIVEMIEEALAATRSLTAELSPPSLQRGALLPALEWLTHWMQERHKFTVRLRPVAAPLPALPEALGVLVYQFVRELLLNAVKHARVVTAEVVVVQDGAALTLTVADTGVGCDPTALRVAGGTEGGFGLLAIRERVESFGGRLEIASAPGQGSRVTVIVPLVPVPETVSAVRPPEVPVVAPGARPPAGRRTRVLVVDDHAVVRRGVATLLAREPDLEVVGEADNGQRAIELTRQLTPDVILMDVSMPGMNGIDATRAIHAEFPALRVIGLSMFENTEQPAALREAGAVRYLSKSDSAEALLAAIRGGGESGRTRPGTTILGGQIVLRTPEAS